jgi:hypothetical protein
LDYGLDDPEFKYYQGTRNLSLLQISRPAVGPIQPSVQWVTGFIFGVKQPRLFVGHSVQFNAEVKNEWRYTSTPPVCLLGVDKDNFTFFLDINQSFDNIVRVTMSANEIQGIENIE